MAGGLVEVGEYQVTAEQIGGVMGSMTTKKLREDQPHDQEGQQRGEHAPGHAKNSAFVFLFEVSLDQFLEKKLVVFYLFYHVCQPCLSSLRISSYTLWQLF